MRSGVPHRVSKTGSPFDVSTGLQDDPAEVLVLFLIAENLQTLHQWQTRIDHHRELPREDRQVSGRHGLDAASSRRPDPLAHCIDSGDEDLFTAQGGQRHIERVCDFLPADGLPPRVRPEYAKVGID